MAKYECHLNASFSAILPQVERQILNSVSASLEDASDFALGDARCAVRVFERYSAIGSNRVSLSVTLFGRDGDIRLSAISSGGSQAMFFKMNTLGEQAFLERLEPVLRPFIIP